MAIESRGFNLGICVASADYSTTGQFRAVYISADMTVATVASKGAIAFGILQNKPKAGEACDVMCVGVSKLVAGTGDLAAAAQWESDNDGSGVTAEAGKVGLGSVLKPAAAGELATVTIGLPCGAVIHA